MKRTKKDNLYVLLLFLSMILTIFIMVYFWVANNVDTGFKVLISIAVIILSSVEFMGIQLINKKYIPVSEDAVMEEVDDNELLDQLQDSTKKYSTLHILCPKCRKPYDGENCFYCGFTKNNE